MNYVEWLRVRNTARKVAIVLGILLVLALAGRIWVGIEFGTDDAVISHMQHDPDAITTHATVNGHAETIIVDPKKHVRVTIEDRADGGRSVTIAEPKSGHADDATDVNRLGSINVSTTTSATTRTTRVDTNGLVPFDIYLTFAYIMGFVVATIFGAAFARENNGHLEYAMLRPVSRERLGLSIMGADIAGILICQAMALVAIYLGQFMWEIPHIDFSQTHLGTVLAYIIMPIAWYMMLNAASASLKRGSGSVIGFAWPVCAFVVVMASIPIHFGAIGTLIHGFFWTISRIVPLTYASTGGKGGNVTFQGDILAGLILLVVYGALAMLQWRRVEA